MVKPFSDGLKDSDIEQTMEDFQRMGFGPYAVTEIQHLPVRMSDGAHIAIKLWLPTSSLHSEPFKVCKGNY